MAHGEFKEFDSLVFRIPEQAGFKNSIVLANRECDWYYKVVFEHDFCSQNSKHFNICRNDKMVQAKKTQKLIRDGDPDAYSLFF